MGKKQRSLLLFLIVFMLFSVVPLANGKQAVLRISYPPFPPFHYLNQKGELEGIFYDIITEAVENRLGIQLSWSPYPWSRCQENVKFGKSDIILTVPTSERAKYTKTHTNPFYVKKLHIFTYVDHPNLAAIEQIRTIEDIKNNDFSVITYSGNGWHKQNIKTQKIRSYESSNLPNVWKMLAGKRGDLVIEWPTAAQPYLLKHRLSNSIMDTEISIANMPFHLLLGKNSPHQDILVGFDAAIDDMKNDGTLSAIIDKY